MSAKVEVDQSIENKNVEVNSPLKDAWRLLS